MAREFRKVGVVGLGTMGAGIAEVLARNGIQVVGVEPTDTALERGRGHIEHSTGRAVSRGKLSAEEQAAIFERIEFTTELERLADSDLVIEAIPERLDLKADLFARLDKICPPETILATNTSALSITEMAEATTRPDKVLGFHFFWPASVMRLIEVIEGEETSEETMQAGVNFAQQIRKTPIRCAEAPGFVVNRILNSAVSEIWRAQEEEGIDPKEIDKVVQESKAAPMGPFFLADMVGLDTTLHVAEHLHEAYGDERFYVHKGMKELVEAGNLGQKTGKGFYEHGN